MPDDDMVSFSFEDEPFDLSKWEEFSKSFPPHRWQTEQGGSVSRDLDDPSVVVVHAPPLLPHEWLGEKPDPSLN